MSPNRLHFPKVKDIRRQTINSILFFINSILAVESENRFANNVQEFTFGGLAEEDYDDAAFDEDPVSLARKKKTSNQGLVTYFFIIL